MGMASDSSTVVMRAARLSSFFFLDFPQFFAYDNSLVKPHNPEAVPLQVTFPVRQNNFNYTLTIHTLRAILCIVQSS